MRKQFPKEYRFFPDTWILPTDMSDFKQQPFGVRLEPLLVARVFRFTSMKRHTFIIKPDNGCQAWIREAGYGVCMK